MVAAAPFFMKTVLSVILKTRDFSLPAIVNVFAFISTDAIMPLNGMERSILAAFAAGDAIGDALAAGAGEADFFDAAKATAGAQNATAAMHAVRILSLFFIVMFVLEVAIDPQ